MRRLLPLATCLVLLLTPVLLLPGHAQEPPKGKIVYARKEGERFVLHVMNADGTGDRELPGQTARLNFLPAVSADGKRLAYMTGEVFDPPAFQLVLAGVDGTGARIVNTGLDLAGLPAWSPDGKRLAFVAGSAEAMAVYVSDAEGNGLRRVSEDGKRALFPFWMGPDTVGYTALPDEAMRKTQLVARKLDGGAPETLVEGEGLLLTGAGGLSPDGKKLAYALLRPDQEGAASLRIRDLASKSDATVLDGKVPTRDGPELLAVASWAPDGSAFVVALSTDTGTALFRVTPDGKKTRLTPDGVSCATPAWFGER